VKKLIGLCICSLTCLYHSLSHSQQRVIVESEFGLAQITNHELGISPRFRPYVFHFIPLDDVPFVLVESITFQDGTSCTHRDCFDFPESAKNLYLSHHRSAVTTTLSFSKPYQRIELRVSPLFGSESDSSERVPNIVYDAGHCDISTTGVRDVAEIMLGDADNLTQSVLAVWYGGKLETTCENY